MTGQNEKRLKKAFVLRLFRPLDREMPRFWAQHKGSFPLTCLLRTLRPEKAESIVIYFHLLIKTIRALLDAWRGRLREEYRLEVEWRARSKEPSRD
jgi:hypothetical protein